MPELANIPGVQGLWALTLGDPRVRVAIIDGPVDLAHPCFDGAAIEIVPTGWLPEGCEQDARLEHATFVAGMLVGQHGSSSPGLAPRCTVLAVPGLRHDVAESDPLNTARSIEAAIGAGAHVVVLEHGHPSRSGDVDGVLKSVVRGAQEAGVLLVVPAGNHDSRYRSFPQALPEVLVVGAYDDDGAMYRFSAWCHAYAEHGIVAPGGNITAAKHGGGLVTHKGTSCSAPIVAGTAALLLSLQLKDGRPPDPLAVREVLLDTAQPCTLEDAHGELGRCLGGKLDIVAATRRVLRRHPAGVSQTQWRGGARASGTAAPAGVVTSEHAAEPASPGPLVYALGRLGYDFGTDARRDSFARLMRDTGENGLPPNPNDARQLLAYLTRSTHPSEAAALIWTLNIELTPIYAIGPIGANAPSIFALLTALLARQLAAAGDETRIERSAIPGRLTGHTVKLLSGQIVPVISVEDVRGIYGWPIAALARAGRPDADNSERLLHELLTRVYYELRNLGLTAYDRALNFAVTNAFVTADTLAEAVAAGMALEVIAVERGEPCRPDSDCWEVTLRFFDPENLRRARRLWRFTVDVGDTVPVTLGPVRVWSESPRRDAALVAADGR